MEEESIWSESEDLSLIGYYNKEVQLTIPLDEGWNLISLPLFQHMDDSIITVLSSISGGWDRVYYYNSTYTKEWVSNNINKPDIHDTFFTFDHKIGFWIHITQSGGTTLTVNGLESVSTSIQLYAGWNLVGYPSETARVASIALSGTGADMMATHNPAAPYLIDDATNLALVTLEQGHGYWIHVPSDAVWTVNW